MSEASERNLEIVRRFEDEFKNKENHGVVDDLMSEDFVHHALFPGLSPGGEGVKAVGQFVVGAIRDISINIDHMVSQDALVADRITARGIRRDTGEPISWTENHFYRLSDGKISEWWPEGGPALD